MHGAGILQRLPPCKLGSPCPPPWGWGAHGVLAVPVGSRCATHGAQPAPQQVDPRSLRAALVLQVEQTLSRSPRLPRWTGRGALSARPLTVSVAEPGAHRCSGAAPAGDRHGGGHLDLSSHKSSYKKSLLLLPVLPITWQGQIQTLLMTRASSERLPQLRAVESEMSNSFHIFPSLNYKSLVENTLRFPSGTLQG